MRHPFRFWVPNLCLLLSIAGAGAARAQDTTRKAPFDLHGFLEVYYRSGDVTIPDGYRLRKADLKFSGDLSPRLKWRISFDAAKVLTLTKTTTSIGDTAALNDVAVDPRTRMVQDVALTWKTSSTTWLDIGQQIIPMSLEGTIPTAGVETIERTMFIIEKSRGTGLGDVRDIGASINRGPGNVFEYHLGLFNSTGEDQNTTATNDQKAVIGRVAFHPPMLAGFQFGGSGAFEGSPTVSQRRERAGGELQYKDNRVTLRTEFIAARDGTLHRLGYYGLVAARPTKDLQFSGRFDWWDRDRSAETSLNDAVEEQVVLGTSYRVEGGAARFMFNVVHAMWPNIRMNANTFGLVAFEGVW